MSCRRGRGNADAARGVAVGQGGAAYARDGGRGSGNSRPLRGQSGVRADGEGSARLIEVRAVAPAREGVAVAGEGVRENGNGGAGSVGAVRVSRNGAASAVRRVGYGVGSSGRRGDRDDRYAGFFLRNRAVARAGRGNDAVIILGRTGSLSGFDSVSVAVRAVDRLAVAVAVRRVDIPLITDGISACNRRDNADTARGVADVEIRAGHADDSRHNGLAIINVQRSAACEIEQTDGVRRQREALAAQAVRIKHDIGVAGQRDAVSVEAEISRALGNLPD